MFQGALVKKAADQLTANYTTATAIAWDAETYDTSGWHDTVTNNSRLTVPGGVTKVRLCANIAVAANTANTWSILDFRKNGSITFDGTCALLAETGATTNNMSLTSPVLEVVGGDYFETFFQTQSDTSITITATRSNFSIESFV